MKSEYLNITLRYLLSIFAECQAHKDRESKRDSPPPEYYFASMGNKVEVISVSSDSENGASLLIQPAPTVVSKKALKKKQTASATTSAQAPGPSPLSQHAVKPGSRIPPLSCGSWVPLVIPPGPSSSSGPSSVSGVIPASSSAPAVPIETPLAPFASAQASQPTPASAAQEAPIILPGVDVPKRILEKILYPAYDRFAANTRPGGKGCRIYADPIKGSELDAYGVPVEPWYAVLRGRYLGIYKDPHQALYALFPLDKDSRLEFCRSEADAAVLFMRAFMDSQLRVVCNGTSYPVGPVAGFFE
ncbi:hypothetical protein AGABI1DRAFT_130602 [Agaricus bisporus var. burnettii JB137-S8]|uniref:Uncharacterized protein n=1 Tax=Agaricus bisporus var. burnettii (strain JB137-S8 / ATCC MYA-4627 / FGSC 10392) TaxID=597362 RepID=K5XQU5_AGABU|nr:uncharacterized protein AGABI1DRAFT_130602 [Agaricus bisporus var. burnettii JB137-S8]EKM77185.1 hypothetical protein AGABI1DRAFT_130602 [Agaricus bisporus var. burnettii JB137-S8]